MERLRVCKSELTHAHKWLEEEEIDAELAPYTPGGKY